MSTNQLTKFSKYWFAALLVTLLVASGFYLCPPAIVKTIGPIQFANSLKAFNELVTIPETAKNIRFNINYDYLFIAVYSILFYLAYRVFQTSMRIKVSKIFVVVCFLPGVFDIIENILLIQLLEQSSSKVLFRSFWLIVRAKWTLAIPLATINLMILVYYFIRFINSFAR